MGFAVAETYGDLEVYFLLFLTDGGFVYDRVEKQVSVCWMCIIRPN